MTAQPARSYNTATLQYSTLGSALLRSYFIDNCETTCPTVPITTTSTRNGSDWQNIEKKLRLIMRHHKGTPHSLQTLNIGDDVLIQDPERTQGQKRWICTGRIVKALPFRQYRVKMHGSGRISLRNRRFLKLTNIPHMSHTPSLIPPALTTNDSGATVTNPTARLPRALRQLRDFNQRGLQE